MLFKPLAVPGKNFRWQFLPILLYLSLPTREGQRSENGVRENKSNCRIQDTVVVTKLDAAYL